MQRKKFLSNDIRLQNDEDAVLMAATLGDITTIRHFVIDANSQPSDMMLKFALQVHRNAYNARQTSVMNELFKINGLGKALTDEMLARQDNLISKHRSLAARSMEVNRVLSKFPSAKL